MKAFGVEKFKSLLFAGSFSVLANYVVRLTDTIVSGHLIGADALSGVNLIAPVLSAVTFLATLIASGTATNYSLALGRLDRTRARQFLTQSLLTSLTLGLGLTLFIVFGTDAFVSYMGPSAEIAGHARRYMLWLAPAPVLECLMATLVLLVCGDGDPKLCTAAYVVNFAVNVLTDVIAVLCGMGTAGCALATTFADLAGLAVLTAHFFRPCNTLELVRHFNLRDTLRIVSASFGDAASFLCNALLFFVLNKFVILKFGSDVLPVAAVAGALWGFLAFFDGIGVAIQPIVTVYYGEGNTRAIRAVMSSAMRVALVEGVGLMILFAVFPMPVVRMVGLSDPATAAAGCLAVRLMCVGFVALSFAGLFNSYYMFVERPGLAAVVTFACYLVCPVACFVLGSPFGENGVWLGLGTGPFLGVVLLSAGMFLRKGRADFPLLLSRDREDRLHVFDLNLTESEIVETSRRIGALPGVPMRAALMAEEVFMVVRERPRNQGRSLLGEVTVDLRDGVRLTLRDDGELFDITDADAKISSLRSFLVASVMERQIHRINLVTSGFNRNVFRF